MNYMGGNGRILSTVPGSPGKFVDNAPVITFPKGSTNVSHPHETYEYKGELLIPDLGADQIWRLGKDNSTGQWSIRGNIPQSVGSGPRHVHVEDDYIYTVHELASTLTLRKLPPTPSNLTEISYISNISTIPPQRPANARYQAAEILAPPATSQFPTRYIYVSNRNTGSTDTQNGDSIAVFQHVNKGTSGEKLQLVNQFFTGLSQPRGMNLDPTTEYLVAGGVAALGGVRVFRRIDGGKSFQLVAQTNAVTTGTAFVWV
jgi:6-phosphogluconolactonase (cycloisomerase 2 family)